jgi:protein-tyrosine phosphatase
MSTTAYERHLQLEGVRNLRDIGGYRTGDGRHTRWRTVYRSDSLHRLSSAAQAQLIDSGLPMAMSQPRARNSAGSGALGAC